MTGLMILMSGKAGAKLMPDERRHTTTQRMFNTAPNNIPPMAATTASLGGEKANATIVTAGAND
jgi:hypothetical protein